MTYGNCKFVWMQTKFIMIITDSVIASHSAKCTFSKFCVNFFLSVALLGRAIDLLVHVINSFCKTKIVEINVFLKNAFGIVFFLIMVHPILQLFAVYQGKFGKKTSSE